MLKSFLSHSNVLFRLLVVLVFAGGLVFAATYDGFSPKIQAENSSCCRGANAAPTDEPVAPSEASGCGCSGTDAFLADGTATQLKVNPGTEEHTPAPAATCSRNKCNTSSCHGSTCNGSCTTVPRARDSCRCPMSSSCQSPGAVCSGYGRCSPSRCGSSCSSS